MGPAVRRWAWRLLASLAYLVGAKVRRTAARRVSTGAYCDYCRCADCQDGPEAGCPIASRLACADGSHICATCLLVEPCQDEIAPLWRKRGRCIWCESHPNCEHKPELRDEE